MLGIRDLSIGLAEIWFVRGTVYNLDQSCSSKFSRQERCRSTIIK